MQREPLKLQHLNLRLAEIDNDGDVKLLGLPDAFYIHRDDMDALCQWWMAGKAGATTDLPVNVKELVAAREEWLLMVVADRARLNHSQQRLSDAVDAVAACLSEPAKEPAKADPPARKVSLKWDGLRIAVHDDGSIDVNEGMHSLTPEQLAVIYQESQRMKGG